MSITNKPENPLKQITQNTDLPEQGFHIVTIPVPSCRKCSSKPLCKQLVEVDSVVVNPGTPLCDTVRSRGPKYSK